MSQETIFATGIFFDKPREGAPDFVKGKVSIKVEDAVTMLKAHVNEKGYVNLDLLKSKDGSKLYFTVNTWKPEKEKNEITENTGSDDRPQAVKEAQAEEINPADIPF